MSKKETRQSWADQVDITDNPERKGIELWFNTRPNPELQTKLRAVGFRPGKKQGLWYTEDSPTSKEFALKVKEAIAQTPEGPELFLTPSFVAVRTNIEKKEFSFVTIELENSEMINYLVFEPSKPRAEVIATNFARKEFGDKFVSLAVKPRSHLPMARMLFDEKKVIESANAKSGDKVKDLKKESPAIDKKAEGKIPVRQILITPVAMSRDPDYTKGKSFDTWKDANEFVRGLIGAHSDAYYKIIWEDGEWIEGVQDLEPIGFYVGKENVLSEHINLFYTNLSKHPPDVIYNRKAVEFAGIIIKNYQLSDEGLPERASDVQEVQKEEKKEGVKHAVTNRDEALAFGKFIDWRNKEPEYENSFPSREVFNQWFKEHYPDFQPEHLDSIWKMHQSTVRTLKRLKGIEEGKSRIQPYSSIYNKLLKVIPGLIEKLKEGKSFHGKSSLNSAGMMDLNFDYLGKDDKGRYTIALSHYYKQNGDMIPDPDMQIRIIPDMEAAEALTFQDTYSFQQVYGEKDGKPTVKPKLKKQLNSFLNTWLTNIIHQGHIVKLSNDDNSETPSKQNESGMSNSDSTNRVLDIHHHEVFIPAILVPIGVPELFVTADFMIGSKEVRAHSELKQFTDKNVGELASPQQLFELIQMGHPDDYGFKVSRQRLLEVFEKKGSEVFEALGYPTDRQYPYVYLGSGYRSVETLGDILTEYDDREKWWSVAEHTRPIGDLNRALKFIGEQIKKENEKLSAYKNPKTGKAKGKDKDKYRASEFILRDYEESKTVITDYLSSLESKNGEDELHTDVPFTNDNGVYTEENAGENFERIEIPFPKGAQYAANVRIAKTSKGDFQIGVDVLKNFGDYNGMGYAPSTNGIPYKTREEALKAGLLEIKERLDLDLTNFDSILDNEEGKNKRVRLAITTLEKFAKDNQIALADKEEQNNSGIINGFEDAYWTKENEAYPVNKVKVSGADFHQARLREILLNKFVQLPIDAQLSIADGIGQEFGERRPLSEYIAGTKVGKGKDRESRALSLYLDDIIIDRDLNQDGDHPVMEKLFSILSSDAEHLIDAPQAQRTKVKEIQLTVKKPKNAHELNKTIEKLIDERDAKLDPFTDDDKQLISQYSGSGGLIKQGAKGRSVLYEYYTPDEIVQKMWGLAYKYGYKNGRILEPSCGTGNFLKYAPEDAIVFGFETNHYAARIAQVLYPNFHIHEQAFETIFFAGNVHLKNAFVHEPYNLVIGNPPYGEFTGKYAGMGEKKWTGASEYEQYFILRCLDLLEPEGLLVFIIPSSFLENKEKFNKTKEKIVANADLLDAFRLPSRIFPTTDIGTDIVVFRKKPENI